MPRSCGTQSRRFHPGDGLRVGRRSFDASPALVTHTDHRHTEAFGESSLLDLKAVHADEAMSELSGPLGTIAVLIHVGTNLQKARWSTWSCHGASSPPPP